MNKNFIVLHYPKLPELIKDYEIFDLVFSKFPKKFMWKLCIDRKDHYRGKYAYDDTDIGYIDGSLNGIEYIRQSINKPLNNNYVYELHTICVKDVVTSTGKTYTIFGPRENRHIFYNFNINKCTSLAKKEWYLDSLIFDKVSCPDKLLTKEEALKKYLSYYNPNSKRRISRVGWQPEDQPHKERIKYAIQKLNNATEKYYKEIYEAYNDEDKLKAIVKLIRFFEICHCFNDGNQRTNNIILIKLLIENGFYPCILQRPEMFAGYLGISEMVEEVIEGIQYFITINDI